jgi:uncharacterized protein with HEPN domain
MKKRNYQDYLKDILDSINDIEEFIRNMSFEEFKKDKKTINVVVRSIEVMGEATKNIPKSLRNKHKEIPWKKIVGMRDKLIHEYFGIECRNFMENNNRGYHLLKNLFKIFLKI